MNINYKEPQFELFPANSATLEDINKPRFLLASLTLSTENLVILLILAIMIGLFSYSIGVERGRSLAAEILDSKAAAAWKVGGRRLAVSPVVPVAAVAPVALVPTKSKAIVNPALRTVAVAPKVMVVNKGLAVPTATVSTTAGNRWTVQVATYKNEKFAQQEALGLKAKGYPVFIAKLKDFYLVCLGQFSTQLQADSFLKRSQVKQGGQVRRI